MKRLVICGLLIAAMITGNQVFGNLVGQAQAMTVTVFRHDADTVLS